MTRACALCRCVLPLADFYKGPTTTRHCRNCRKIRAATAKRLQYQRDAEGRKKQLAAQRARYFRNHEQSKAKLRARYARDREKKLRYARQYRLRKAREHFQAFGHQLLRIRPGHECRTCAQEFIARHYGRRVA